MGKEIGMKFVIGVVLLVSVAITIASQYLYKAQKQDSMVTGLDLQQISTLSEFDELSSFFKELSVSKGAEHAFTVLGQGRHATENWTSLPHSTFHRTQPRRSSFVPKFQAYTGSSAIRNRYILL